MFDPPSLPAAGWYRDPDVPGAERWWNGRAWEPDWRSTVVPAEPGGLPDVSGWIGRAVRRSILRWRAVLVVALLTGAPASVLVALATRLLVDGVVITDDDVIGWSNDRLPLAIVLSLIGLVLSAVGALATATMMLRTVDETAAPDDTAPTMVADDVDRAMRSIGVGLRLLPRTIGWSLMLAIAVLGAAAAIVAVFVVVWPLGVLLLLLVFPLAVWAAIRLAFVLQALVDRPGSPFGRSAVVSRARWWAVFGRLLLIGIIAWGISMVVNVSTMLVVGGGAFGSTTIEFDENGRLTDNVVLAELVPVSTASIVVGVIGAVILTVCVSSLSGAAMGELYRTRNPPE